MKAAGMPAKLVRATAAALMRTDEMFTKLLHAPAAGRIARLAKASLVRRQRCPHSSRQQSRGLRSVCRRHPAAHFEGRARAHWRRLFAAEAGGAAPPLLRLTGSATSCPALASVHTTTPILMVLQRPCCYPPAATRLLRSLSVGVLPVVSARVSGAARGLPVREFDAPLYGVLRVVLSSILGDLVRWLHVVLND